MKSSTKRLLSLVIVLAMALSMLPMIAFAEAPTTLYVKPNTNWNQSGARFAAYFFGTGNTWVDCTDADGDGVYEVTVPAGNYTHIIFCRMNPNAAANSWNNKWNQTKDLPLADTSATANCYVVADGSWDKGNGQWVEYIPGGQIETDPTTASPIKYSVAGEATLCGSAWTPEDINNMMTDADEDGIYTITYSEVAAGTYKFKVTDGTWTNAWPAQDYVLKVEAKANVTISFNTADNTVVVDIELLEDPIETSPTEPVPVTYIVAGSAGLCGSAWTPEDASNQMADEDGDGIYTISYTAVPAGSYEFKVTDGTWNNAWPGENYQFTLVKDADVTINFNSADNSIEVVSDGIDVPVTEPFVPGVREYCLVGYINGADYGCNDDHENVGEYIFVDGKLTATFTAESYIFVKTTDNANWLLTEAFCSETTGTFVAGGAEKMQVPANVEITFTLVENEDGSVTVSYVTGEAVEPPVTEPTEPTEPTVPTEPAPKAYCLVGYINGADYGCNDDYENVGEYIFVDGTLTATFTADSYVFVKTTDNANWYLTEAYTEETTATFVAGAAEKMKVPGGVEVTFTLVENEDGSITVSYVTNGEPAPDPDPEPDPDPLVINSVHVAGASGLTGFEWDPTANAMTGTEGIYTLTFTGIAAGSYEFKFVANGSWELNWSANGVMENEVVCDAYMNVMGNSTVVVPGNDATVTLTLDLTAMDAVTGEGAKCSVAVSDYIAVEKEYCLVGYINGADYGCNDDYENVGEYIFVDGKLTATFTADSYIFVKTTDNANWYLTEAYTEETSATFVAGAAEKMKVPGGVELTFTLVENENGSVTVSYEAAASGVTVSGAVKTGTADDTTIELLDGETVVATATVSGKEGTYSIENVAAGTYTLKISKLNHVTREYTVTVGSEDLTQDVKIHMVGDIDGNGKVNTGDVAKLNAHLKGTNKLTDEYMILCANVNGGRLNMGDTATLYSHIKGTKKLY